MSEFIDEAVQYLRILGRGVLADEVADLHKAAAILAVEKAELRAQVAALTAELSRVKALVGDAPVVAVIRSQKRQDSFPVWISGVDIYRALPSGTELIARPNLEKKT